MSNKPYKGFEPKWLLTPAPADSYRSIFRWGDPNFFKYPKESLYTLMKETFQMTDDDFKEYSDDIGFDPVDLSDHPVQLAPEHIEALKKIVGERNVSTTDYARLSVAYGFTAYDILRLRHKRIDSVPDVVLYPETTGQVEQIVAYSTEHHIPLYVYGGGSSVTESPTWMVPPCSTRANTPSRGMMHSPVCCLMTQSLWHSLPIWVISSTTSPMAKRLVTGRLRKSKPSMTRFSPKAP